MDVAHDTHVAVIDEMKEPGACRFGGSQKIIGRKYPISVCEIDRILCCLKTRPDRRLFRPILCVEPPQHRRFRVARARRRGYRSSRLSQVCAPGYHRPEVRRRRRRRRRCCCLRRLPRSCCRLERLPPAEAWAARGSLCSPMRKPSVEVPINRYSGNTPLETMVRPHALRFKTHATLRACCMALPRPSRKKTPTVGYMCNGAGSDHGLRGEGGGGGGVLQRGHERGGVERPDHVPAAGVATRGALHVHVAAAAPIIPVSRPSFSRVPPGMRSIHLSKCRGLRPRHEGTSAALHYVCLPFDSLSRWSVRIRCFRIASVAHLLVDAELHAKIEHEHHLEHEVLVAYGQEGRKNKTKGNGLVKNLAWLALSPTKPKLGLVGVVVRRGLFVWEA